MTPSKTLLLASASPARLRTLRAAGIEPLVRVSDIDEDGVLAELAAHATAPLSASTQVAALAQAKGRAVLESTLIESAGIESLDQAHYSDQSCDVLVACDSMFDMGGTIVGKPHTADVARERLHQMSGNSGNLYTGHWIYDYASRQSVSGISRATVHIAKLSDAEIDAYIATGEPLVVAGSFTIDGFGGSFVERIEGDPHGVVGISLPLVRQLLAKLDINITEFWSY